MQRRVSQERSGRLCNASLHVRRCLLHNPCACSFHSQLTVSLVCASLFRGACSILLSSPADARFHDGLAFTRSLGDFYLHTFGVSSQVDVQMVDLSGLNSPDASSCAAICLCSDGLWDNWKYHDVITQLFSKPCV